MTFDDLKDLEIDTVLVDEEGEEYFYRGISKFSGEVIVETLLYGIETHKEREILYWKIKPSQNTVTLYEYLNRYGSTVFLNDKNEHPDFPGSKFNETPYVGVQKIPNGRTLTLDLDTWQICDE